MRREPKGETEEEVSKVGAAKREQRAEALITCKYLTHRGYRCLRGKTKAPFVDQLL